MSEEKNSISSATKEYTQILLHQYSECWQSIRNDSNAVWQIPTLLLATISVLGIAYTQASNIPIGRILMLSVGLGFSLVSLIALVKHRLSCNCKTVDFENIEKQLMRLLKQEEFESLFKKINKDARENEKVRFREIKFMGKDIADSFEFRERHIFGKWELKKECLASERRWFYRRSAYD